MRFDIRMSAIATTRRDIDVVRTGGSVRWTRSYPLLRMWGMECSGALDGRPDVLGSCASAECHEGQQGVADAARNSAHGAELCGADTPYVDDDNHADCRQEKVVNGQVVVRLHAFLPLNNPVFMSSIPVQIVRAGTW